VLNGGCDYPMPQEFPLGQFEVYFMGVRLFSKLQAKVFPDLDQVSEKCIAAYNAFIGGSLPQFE